MTMKIKDKELKVFVDVVDKDCLGRKCYWPRPDPGMFVQGRGYRQRAGGSAGWLCGTREVRGCPSSAFPPRVETKEKGEDDEVQDNCGSGNGI